MNDHETVTTIDQKPRLTALIRRLPAMLAGRVPDEGGVAAGFRARIGLAFFSLVAPNFTELGRGLPGADGNRWHPLSPEYLAYQRGVTSRQPPKAGGLAPGGKDGFLTKDQLALWRRTYAEWLAWFIMREPEAAAKSHAAAIAWNQVKKAGAKTKLKEFGSRQPGVDYQMLVDRGTLRQSLAFGVLSQRGPAADYQSPIADQVYDSQPSALVVGTRVPYAAAHHNAKNPQRRRRLWPEKFPSDWWRQILNQAQGGLARIGELFGGAA